MYHFLISFYLSNTHLYVHRQSLKEQNKSKNRRIRQQDTSLTAELRNVIVLFISVKLDSEQLLTSRNNTDSADPRSGSVKMSSSSTAGASMSEKASEKASAHCYVHSGDRIHSRIKGFHFLSRTEEEFNDDQRIMNRLVYFCCFDYLSFRVYLFLASFMSSNRFLDQLFNSFS